MAVNRLGSQPLGQAVPTAAGRPPEADALRESAREFEAFFLEQMLKQMRSSTRALSGEKPSFGRETYEGWQDTEMARSMAGGIGTGIGEMLYKQLQEQALRQESKE